MFSFMRQYACRSIPGPINLRIQSYQWLTTVQRRFASQKAVELKFNDALMAYTPYTLRQNPACCWINDDEFF